MPTTLAVSAPSLWIIDHHGVRRWYYRCAPAIGDTVRYLEDGYDDAISYVTATHIGFVSGFVMRRPFQTSRLAEWSLPRLRMIRNSLNRPSPRFKSQRSSVLRPDASTIYV